jgi:hypothetical protein
VSFHASKEKNFSSLYPTTIELSSSQGRDSEMHLLDNDQAGDGLPLAGLQEASSVPHILKEGRVSVKLSPG